MEAGQKTITKGARVKVFSDPMTMEHLEGYAIVTKVVRTEPWLDTFGRQVVRCEVRFYGGQEDEIYTRDVSEATQ